MSSNAAQQKTWIDQVLIDQLSKERDFPGAPPVSFRYGVLCGHRTGSNMLTEALYETGMAGDPLELFNIRMIEHLYKERGVDYIPPQRYIEEMEARRTSPNGVFSFNIKFDQYRKYFKHNIAVGEALIKKCDLVIFHYRKDKLRQAISIYIGRQRDTFRIPAGADYNKVKEMVETIPMNAAAICHAMTQAIAQEQQWLKFLHTHNIPYEPLAYEDLASDYEGTIDHVLDKIGVPKGERRISEPPTMKISTSRNETLHQQFLEYIGGQSAIFDIMNEQDLEQLVATI